MKPTKPDPNNPSDAAPLRVESLARARGTSRGERWFRSLVQNSSDVVMILEADGTVRYVSPAVERVLGYRPEDFVGTLALDYVHPEDVGYMSKSFAETLQKPGVHPPIEYRVRTADGSWRHMEVIRSNWLGDPHIAGVVANVRDVTERKRVEEALRRSESSLAAAQRIAHLGNWDYSITNDEAQWSDEMYRIFGFAPQQFVPRYRTFLNSVHLDDRDLIRRSVRKALYEEKQGCVDYRVVRPDGEVRVVQSRYEVTRDMSNRAVKLAGTVHDITERKQAEERLREAEERYRTLVETVPAVTYTDRAVGSYPDMAVYTSPQIEALVGYSVEEWLDPERDLWEERLHPEDRAWVLDADERSKATGEPFAEEYRLIAKDGRVVWVRDEAVLTRNEAGEPLYWQGVLVDVTERKQAEERLREAEERYRTVVEEQTELVCRFLPDLTLTFVNDAYCRYFGQTFRELIGNGFLGHIPEEDRTHYQRALFGLSREYSTRTVEHRVFASGGEVRWMQWTDTAIFDGEGRVVEYQSVGRDVTEQKVLEERLEHRAFHDSLTDLPNRYLFVDRLKQALRRTRRKKSRQAAVLFMDLDDFKAINDSLGHEAGDLLLVVVAERLRRCLRPEDTLARFGGDEFVVLIEDVGSPEDAVRVAERIVEGLREPFIVEGRELFLRASMGVALGTARQKSPEDLLRDADTAMYEAKEAGLGYRVFDPAMYERAVGRLELENELRRAIEADEFVLHYQPIMSLRTGEIWGVEALVRWSHPERGLLDPWEFMAVAERSGIVVPMGEGVLQEACHQAKEWQEEHPRIPPLVMSVNLSARQLQRPDIAQIVERVLKKTGLEARCLRLDITETVYIKALEGNTQALDELKRLGVSISIDDFGTGYSSLAYLKRLPANALKVDKSFVKGIGEDLEDTAIVGMVIELAHTLGMEAIAEGVENEAQATVLKEMGCDKAQGFYFSEPLPPETATRFLAEVRTS